MGLFKRGSIWWMSFFYKGKRYRKSAETEDKKFAQRIYDKVKGEIAEGKWFDKLPGEDKTFREMVERFETEHLSQLASYKAAKSYVTQLKNFFGDYLVSEVTPSLINEFKLKRKAQGVKPATIRRQFDILKRAFNIAMKEWEWCSSNTVTRVSLERANNARDRWLTIDEEEKLLQVCPQWLKEIVVFALNTGCRLSEIRFLTWKGADLFNDVPVTESLDIVTETY